MAYTSYKSRILIKEHTGDDDVVTLTGTWNLLLAAKSIPAPVSAPNTVESTTLEDDAQTYEEGIKTSDQKEVTGNLEKEYLENVEVTLKGKRVDVMQIYGTDGIGSVAKYAYIGQLSATVSDIGGVDEIVEMTVTITPNTAAELVTDDVTLVDNGDGTLTATAA